jgi:hypothetical protein
LSQHVAHALSGDDVGQTLQSVASAQAPPPVPVDALVPVVVDVDVVGFVPVVAVVVVSDPVVAPPDPPLPLVVAVLLHAAIGAITETITPNTQNLIRMSPVSS